MKIILDDGREWQPDAETAAKIAALRVPTLEERFPVGARVVVPGEWRVARHDCNDKVRPVRFDFFVGDNAILHHWPRVDELDGITVIPDIANPFNLTPSQIDELREAYYYPPRYEYTSETMSGKIAAIKRLREMTACGLKEAKDAVEAMFEPAVKAAPAPSPRKPQPGDQVFIRGRLRRYDSDGDAVVEYLDYSDDEMTATVRPESLVCRNEAANG